MTYTLIKLFTSSGWSLSFPNLPSARAGWGALLATLPSLSLLAIVWLYVDNVATLSTGIFWLVRPSLTFLVAVLWLLRRK